MNRPDRLTGSVAAPFHSVSHYTSPADVLDDAALSPAEKRVILSSWASDMYAVDSCPGLRQIPGIAEPMYLKDILAALRKLDKRMTGRAAATLSWTRWRKLAYLPEAPGPASPFRSRDAAETLMCGAIAGCSTSSLRITSGVTSSRDWRRSLEKSVQWSSHPSE
jgi:hypothetical protein